jgi:hypothetical protein
VLIAFLAGSLFVPGYQNLSVNDHNTDIITEPLSWLFSWLSLSIGLPFIGLSIINSLVQSWVARLSEPAIKNPYILYAASNAGSLLGLICYPFLLEPWVRLDDQISIWKSAFFTYIVFIGISTWIFVRLQRPNKELQEPARAWVLPTADTFLLWLALAAVPSALLSAVTQHILTDIASVPLLWLIPLILYLITFIIAFSIPQKMRLNFLSRMTALFPLMAIVGIILGANQPPLPIIVIHLLSFFCISLLAHTLLSLKRPPQEILTIYYLTLSLGGTIGGISMLFLAPLIFSSPVEYPLMILLGVSTRIAAAPSRVLAWRSMAIAIGTALLLCITAKIAAAWIITPELEEFRNLITYVPIVVYCYSRVLNPKEFLTILVTFFLFCQIYPADNNHVLASVRNFFGTLRVLEREDDHCRELYYGTTIHGIECPSKAGECEPLTYYHRSSSVGELFKVSSAVHPEMSVGIIGLGIGSLSCYARPQDTFTFFELNPLVEKIARTDRYFTQLKQSPSQNTKILMGDARLTLQNSPELKFDLLVIDAFSSDAIPVHLLTLEAVEMYQRHLKADAVIAFHISNRFFDLKPVLAKIAESLGLDAWELSSQPVERSKVSDYFDSEWVVLAKNTAELRALLQNNLRASLLKPNSNQVWTDQYSSPLTVLRPELFKY